MKLHEYQSKQIFARYGIPIPKGRIAGTSSEVKQIAEELGGRVVVKSQVLVGGRGKAGGIRLAKTPEEAQDLATILLSMDIKGLPVRKVLVDEAVSIAKEFYVGIVNDRTSFYHAQTSLGTNLSTMTPFWRGKVVGVRVGPAPE